MIGHGTEVDGRSARRCANAARTLDVVVDRADTTVGWPGSAGRRAGLPAHEADQADGRRAWGTGTISATGAAPVGRQRPLGLPQHLRGLGVASHSSRLGGDRQVRTRGSGTP